LPAGNKAPGKCVDRGIQIPVIGRAMISRPMQPAADMSDLHIGSVAAGQLGKSARLLENPRFKYGREIPGSDGPFQAGVYRGEQFFPLLHSDRP
jgi:hypothetical protein